MTHDETPWIMLRSAEPKRRKLQAMWSTGAFGTERPSSMALFWWPEDGFTPEALQASAEDPKLQQRIVDRTCLGTMSPDDPHCFGIAEASHLVTSVSYDADDHCLRVWIEFLDTINGRILQGMVAGGAVPVLAAAGYGYAPGYRFFTFHAVDVEARPKVSPPPYSEELPAFPLDVSMPADVEPGIFPGYDPEKPLIAQVKRRPFVDYGDPSEPCCALHVDDDGPNPAPDDPDDGAILRMVLSTRADLDLVQACGLFGPAQVATGEDALRQRDAGLCEEVAIVYRLYFDDLRTDAVIAHRLDAAARLLLDAKGKATVPATARGRLTKARGTLAAMLDALDAFLSAAADTCTGDDPRGK